MRLIEQYLGDEGFLATKLVLHDESNLKSKERDERATEGKKLKRAILGASCELARSWARADGAWDRRRLDRGGPDCQQTACADSEGTALLIVQAT